MPLYFPKPGQSVYRLMTMSSSFSKVLACAGLGLVLAGMPVFAQRSSAASAASAHRSQFVPNRYTVLLADPSVASRFATREELSSSAALAYKAQLETRQDNLKREFESRSFKVTGSVSVLLNAIFVDGPSERLDDLKSVPGVLAVYPMRRFKPSLNRAVQAMNAPAAWTALGGVANAGKGMKIRQDPAGGLGL